MKFNALYAIVSDAMTLNSRSCYFGYVIHAKQILLLLYVSLFYGMIVIDDVFDNFFDWYYYYYKEMSSMELNFFNDEM